MSFDRVHPQFGERLREAIHNQGITQKDLAAQMGCKPATVSQWVNHRSYPPSDRLAHMCRILRVSADWLLDLSDPVEHDKAGIRWSEQLSGYLSLEQQGEIQLGLDIFHAAVEGLFASYDWISAEGLFPNENWMTLTRAYKAAIRSDALKIRAVQRDFDREKQLYNLFPSSTLRHVIVATVPQTANGRYLTFEPLRTELVAFLAATIALSKSSLQAKTVGIGYGYTMQRFAEQTIPSQNHYSGTNWAALTILEDPHLAHTGLSANCVASILAIRHPGSDAHLLPYIAAPDRSRLYTDPATLTYQQRIALHTLHILRNATALFFSVNGGGHFLQDDQFQAQPFQTVDREFIYREGLQAYRKLSLQRDEEDFGCELLGWLLDKQGNIIGPDEAAVFSIDMDTIRTISELNHVWAVAAGAHKAHAVLTLLENRLANALVIDSEIAEILIREKTITNPATVESSHEKLLSHVREARHGIRAVHRAFAPEEVHHWQKDPGAVNYYHLNQELLHGGKTVQRIFILRQQAFFNPHTRSYDPNTREIIRQQQTDGVDVRIVWEESIKKPVLLDDIVIIDSDLVYVNQPSGVVFHGWRIHVVKSQHAVEQYIQKFYTLLERYSLSIAEAFG